MKSSMWRSCFRAVAEVDVGPAQGRHLAPAQRTVEEQPHDRAVDQAAALGRLLPFEAAAAPSPPRAGGEDGVALVGRQPPGLSAAGGGERRAVAIGLPFKRRCGGQPGGRLDQVRGGSAAARRAASEAINATATKPSDVASTQPRGGSLRHDFDHARARQASEGRGYPDVAHGAGIK